MAQDHTLRVDLMSALVAFTSSEEERRYWNGFAMYCMEIAAGFINAYKIEFRSPPPGIDARQLEKKQMDNSHSLTRAEINAYVQGGKVNTDFQAFMNRLNGDAHPSVKQAQENLKKAEDKKRKAEQEQRIAREQQKILRESVESQLNALQQAISRLAQAQQTTSQIFTQNKTESDSLRDKLLELQRGTQVDIKGMAAQLKRLEDKRTKVAQAILEEVDRLKAMTDGSNLDETNEILGSIEGMLRGSEVVETSEENLQRLSAEIEMKKGEIKRLKMDIKTLNTQIAELKEALEQAQLALQRGDRGGGASAGSAGAASIPAEVTDVMTKLCALAKEDANETDVNSALTEKLKWTAFVNAFNEEFAEQMKEIGTFVKKQRFLLKAIKRFQKEYNEDFSVNLHRNIREDLKKSSRGDQNILTYFDSVLGFGIVKKAVDFFGIIQREDHIELSKNVCLKLVNSGADLRSMDFTLTSEDVGSDVESRKKFRNLAEMEHVVRLFKQASDQCLIQHLYILLKLAVAGTQIDASQVTTYLDRIVSERTKIDFSDIQRIPNILSIQTVCSGSSPRDFPYTLFHKGIYNANCFESIADLKPFLVARNDNGQNMVLLNGKPINTALTKSMATYGNEIKKHWNDLKPVN